MCKVSELIEYLQALPPDTEVEVLERYIGSYATDTRWESLELGDCSDTCFFANGTLYLGED